MRTAFAVALSLIVGACATLGGGGTGPFGTWDIVSFNGEPLPVEGLEEGWCELSADGTELCTLFVEGMAEPILDSSPYTLGEMENGCLPYETIDDEGQTWIGSICGDVFTVDGPGQTVVLHKRR